MRRGQAVQGRLILLILPPHCEVMLLVAFEIGGAHGGPNEIAAGCG
jgi:hypothetical protein